MLRLLGNFEEAASSCKKAIALMPNYHEEYFNLSNAQLEMRQSLEATESCKNALALNPNFVEAHNNPGLSLQLSGLEADAEASFKTAIRIEPELAARRANLGLSYLARNEYDQAPACFEKSCELLRSGGHESSLRANQSVISKAKVTHDLEQWDYLAFHNPATRRYFDLARIYRNVESNINWPSETDIIDLPDAYGETLKTSHNIILHRRPAPILDSPAVNRSLNREEITKNYFRHDFGLTYFDDFLSNKALNSLRNFLLSSTIWFDIKDNGYLGCYLGQGLACPLVLQVARELKETFPKILKDHPLRQAWAYKYDSRAQNPESRYGGIDIHADFAAVNVNFWVTPDTANLNPKSSGLVIYNVGAPADWHFNSYNNDQEKIRRELRKSSVEKATIPYR